MSNAQKPIRLGRLLGASDAFVLEAEIDVLVSRLAKAYPSLPGDAQAHVILVGHSLARLRRKLIRLEMAGAHRRRRPDREAAA